MVFPVGIGPILLHPDDKDVGIEGVEGIEGIEGIEGVEGIDEDIFDVSIPPNENPSISVLCLNRYIIRNIESIIKKHIIQLCLVHFVSSNFI